MSSQMKTLVILFSIGLVITLIIGLTALGLTIKYHNDSNDANKGEIQGTLPPGSVDLTMLSSATTDEIKNSKVGTSRIQDLAVTQEKLADEVVSSINNSLVGRDRLEDNAVSSGKLSESVINTILTSAVGTERIDDLAVSAGKLSQAVQDKLDAVAGNTLAKTVDITDEDFLSQIQLANRNINLDVTFDPALTSDTYLLNCLVNKGTVPITSVSTQNSSNAVFVINFESTKTSNIFKGDWPDPSTSSALPFIKTCKGSTNYIQYKGNSYAAFAKVSYVQFGDEYDVKSMVLVPVAEDGIASNPTFSIDIPVNYDANIVGTQLSDLEVTMKMPYNSNVDYFDSDLKYTGDYVVTSNRKNGQITVTYKVGGNVTQIQDALKPLENVCSVKNRLNFDTTGKIKDHIYFISGEYKADDDTTRVYCAAISTEHPDADGRDSGLSIARTNLAVNGSFTAIGKVLDGTANQGGTWVYYPNGPQGYFSIRKLLATTESVEPFETILTFQEQNSVPVPTGLEKTFTPVGCCIIGNYDDVLVTTWTTITAPYTFRIYVQYWVNVSSSSGFGKSELIYEETTYDKTIISSNLYGNTKTGTSDNILELHVTSPSQTKMVFDVTPTDSSNPKKVNKYPAHEVETGLDGSSWFVNDENVFTIGGERNQSYFYPTSYSGATVVALSVID